MLALSWKEAQGTELVAGHCSYSICLLLFHSHCLGYFLPLPLRICESHWHPLPMAASGFRAAGPFWVEQERLLPLHQSSPDLPPTNCKKATTAATELNTLNHTKLISRSFLPHPPQGQGGACTHRRRTGKYRHRGCCSIPQILHPTLGSQTPTCTGGPAATQCPGSQPHRLCLLTLGS